MGPLVCGVCESECGGFEWGVFTKGDLGTRAFSLKVGELWAVCAGGEEPVERREGWAGGADGG